MQTFLLTAGSDRKAQIYVESECQDSLYHAVGFLNVGIYNNDNPLNPIGMIETPILHPQPAIPRPAMKRLRLNPEAASGKKTPHSRKAQTSLL